MGHSYMKALSPSRLYTEAHSIKALILKPMTQKQTAAIIQEPQ